MPAVHHPGPYGIAYGIICGTWGRSANGPRFNPDVQPERTSGEDFVLRDNDVCLRKGNLNFSSQLGASFCRAGREARWACYSRVFAWLYGRGFWWGNCPEGRGWWSGTSTYFMSPARWVISGQHDCYLCDCPGLGVWVSKGNNYYGQLYIKTGFTELFLPVGPSIVWSTDPSKGFTYGGLSSAQTWAPCTFNYSPDPSSVDLLPAYIILSTHPSLLDYPYITHGDILHMD